MYDSYDRILTGLEGQKINDNGEIGPEYMDEE
jgi:hypothetical protein